MKSKSVKPETAAKAKPVAAAKAKPLAKPVAKKPAVKVAVEPKGRNSVTMVKLKEMAKDLGLKGVTKMDRNALIHAIQVAEGHAACYARIPDCGQMDCLFRPDCLPEMGVII